MNLSSRNRKCAISRWKRVRKHQLGQINPDKILLARICGYLAGDGSIQIRVEKNGKRHHSIEFFPDDVSLIPPFVTAFQSVFKSRLRIVTLANHYRVRIFSKTAVTYLFGLTDFGVYNWYPPWSILANERAKEEWLRAYFDSEAYVCKSSIRVQSVNLRGLNAVETLLGRCRIACTRFTYTPKNENWSKVFILAISKREDRLRFLNKIGFNHKQKKKKLLSQFSDAEVA